MFFFFQFPFHSIPTPRQCLRPFRCQLLQRMVWCRRVGAISWYQGNLLNEFFTIFFFYKCQWWLTTKKKKQQQQITGSRIWWRRRFTILYGYYNGSRYVHRWRRRNRSGMLLFIVSFENTSNACPPSIYFVVPSMQFISKWMN